MNTEITTPNKAGLSIASMVCGIVSLVLCCLMPLSIILAIVSLVLGAISLKRQYAGRGMAIAGVTCSIVALSYYAIYIIYYLIVGTALISLS